MFAFMTLCALPTLDLGVGGISLTYIYINLSSTKQFLDQSTSQQEQ